MVSIAKYSVVFLLTFLCVAHAEYTDVEEADLDIDARRARSEPRCFCAPLNEDIICKDKQKKEKFLTDDHCKCPKYRCVWEICPEVKDVKCKKCQVKVEVDDCGCKQFECQDVLPNHCAPNAVNCDKCSKLVQTKDECGCPADKCVPMTNPPSKCPCKECETCEEVETGPEGCGLKESICLPVKCPPFEELMCDPDCETMEFVTSKCGCASMKCVPIDDKTVPVCDKCHEAKKRMVKKCGREKWECVPKRCEGPEPGKEVCFDTLTDKKDSCGCPTLKKKKCSLVPAGDCPKGTVAQGGFDLCGCPHQICVPCKQVYPQTKKCKKCEKQEMVDVANGQCKEAVCVATPECNCPQSSPAECGECEVKGKVRISEHCVVNACVPSKAKECVCKELMTKKACGKCEKSKPVRSGQCKGVKTCLPMSAEDCPKMGSPNCPACQKPDVVIDECGCKKFVCKKAPCEKMGKDMIKCDANKHKKQATIGLDACKCLVQSCVDKDKVCEEPATKKPPTVDVGPFSFGKSGKYGKLVLRNERHSGISTFETMNNRPSQNIKTGKGYSNLITPLNGAWWDKDFIQHWAQNMKDNTKIHFMFWKRKEGGIEDVVHLTFRASGDVNNWFDKSHLTRVTGPDVGGNRNYNNWSADGDRGNGRNYFVNKSYGGCGNDQGMLVVTDKVDVCKDHWAGGKGWESFPRFLYASNPNGCNWADLNCVREADVMTISVE